MHFRTSHELNLSAARQKLLFVLIPVLGWAVLFLGRPLWYHPFCAVIPTPCVTSSVNAFDQIVFQFGSIRADFMSTVIQNTVAVIAFLFPWLLYSSSGVQKALGETYYLLQATLWNLFALETIRAFVQRPRPLLFNNPMGDGANIHQYTSFYSGHTSFVALASLCMFFMVRRRFSQSKGFQLNFLLLYLCLVTATGCLRIIGGRHYPTDVIFGFLIGSGIALLANSTDIFKKK